MDIRIRNAEDRDLDAVIGLRSEAEAWLREAGITQWTDHARGVRSIQASIAAGAAYVVHGPGGHLIASLTLSGPDLDFWGAADNPEAGLYLYKFMVTQQYRGSGLGDELLDWSCQQAAMRGHRYLRLDCWRENRRLHRYYLRRGFRHVKTVTVPGRQSGVLFERPADTRLVARPRMLCADLTR